MIQRKEGGFFVLKLCTYKRGVGFLILNEDEIERAIDDVGECIPINEE